MYLEATILIIFFLLMAVGFRLLSRHIFSPWMVTLVVWIGILFLYVTVDHGLYDITNQLINGLLIWVCSFSVSSYAGFRLSPNNKAPEWEVCEKNLDIITICCVLVVPYATYKAVQNAMMIASPEGLFYTLREQMLDSEMFDMGIAKYFVYIVYVVLIIEANRIQLHRWRLALMIVIGFLFILISMSKTTIFMYIISVLYLLYSNGKISLKPIAIFFCSFFFLGLLLQLVRGGEEDTSMDSESILWFLAVYVVSPMQAFCTDIANSSNEWGQYTFRTLYGFLQHLGFNVEVSRVIEKWVWVPLPTNVYTIMSPYFRDFGYWGLFVFGTLEGFVSGILFRLGVTGNTIVKYLYTYVLVYIFLQFFQENFFLAASSFMYITALLLFCHIRFKFNFKHKDRF